MLIVRHVPLEPLVCSPSGGDRLVHLEGRCTCSHPNLCTAVQESARIRQQQMKTSQHKNIINIWLSQFTKLCIHLHSTNNKSNDKPLH